MIWPQTLAAPPHTRIYMTNAYRLKNRVCWNTSTDYIEANIPNKRTNTRDQSDSHEHRCDNTWRTMCKILYVYLHIYSLHLFLNFTTRSHAVNSIYIANERFGWQPEQMWYSYQFNLGAHELMTECAVSISVWSCVLLVSMRLCNTSGKPKRFHYMQWRERKRVARVECESVQWFGCKGIPTHNAIRIVASKQQRERERERMKFPIICVHNVPTHTTLSARLQSHLHQEQLNHYSYKISLLVYDYTISRSAFAARYH